MVSINDIVLAAAADKSIRKQDLLDTLESICAHHRLAEEVVTAA